MTLVSSIIKQSLREGNVIAIGADPTTAEIAEALDRLQGVVQSALGNDIGDELHDLTLGGEWDQAWALQGYVPENARLVLSSSGTTTVQLHPRPYDGQRIAVVDAGRNLATSNLTLDGNGRLIEGAATVVLSTDGLAANWLYRADIGDWKRIDTLAEGDTFPLPVEFDDYFIIMLAMRLNPRFGREMSQASAVRLQQQRQQLEARYRKPRPVQDWGSLGLLHQRRWDYGGWSPLR